MYVCGLVLQKCLCKQNFINDQCIMENEYSRKSDKFMIGLIMRWTKRSYNLYFLKNFICTPYGLGAKELYSFKNNV